MEERKVLHLLVATVVTLSMMIIVSFSCFFFHDVTRVSESLSIQSPSFLRDRELNDYSHFGSSNNYEYQLVVATTFMDTIDPIKIDIQKAVLKSWSLLPKPFKLVVFTDSEYWKERANELNITWSDKFKLNQHDLPFLTSMTEWIKQHYRSHLYGYTNGDIVFHSSFTQIFSHLHFPGSLMVVGRRYNVGVDTSFLSHFSSKLSSDAFIEDAIRYSEQFIPVAQDYFFFSADVVSPSTVAPVVVGRNRIDNYLLTICKQNQRCTLIDASDSIIALHLSDEQGDFSGTKAKVDSDWNVQLIGNNDFYNSVNFADWRLSRSQSGVVFSEKNKFFDDAFSAQQIRFLQRYFTESFPCVYFGSGKVGLTFGKQGLFHPSPLLTVLSDKWFYTKANAVINYLSGETDGSNGSNGVNDVNDINDVNESLFESVRLPNVWDLDQHGACSRYAEYIRFYADAIDENAVRRGRKCPGCPAFSKKNNRIIVDGDCRFFVLRELSGIVSFSSYIIVPDLNLQKYDGMESIEQGLDLVDYYEPSMKDDDFRSIHVFQRSRTKTWSLSLPE